MEQVVDMALEILVQNGLELTPADIQRIKRAEKGADLLALGSYYYGKENVVEAKAMYNQVVRKYQNLEAMLKLDQMYRQDSMEYNFQPFLSLEKSSDLDKAANYFYGLEEWQKSEQLYKKIEQPSVDVLIRMDKIANQLGKDFDFQRFLSLEKSYDLNKAANYFYVLREWQKAEQLYEKIEQPSVDVLIRMDKIANQLGKDFDFKRFLRLYNSNDILQAANYFYDLEEWQKAEQLYEKIEQPSADVLIRMDKIANQLGKDFDFKRFLSLNKLSDLNNVANYFYDLEEWQKAGQLYEKIEQPSVDVLIRLDEIADQLGKDFDFKRFLSLYNSNDILQAANYFFDLEEWQKAEQLYEKIEQPSANVLIRMDKIAGQLGKEFDLFAQITDDNIVDFVGAFSAKFSENKTVEENLSICHQLLQLKKKAPNNNGVLAELKGAGINYNTPIWNLILAGKFAEAETALQCALQLAPEDIYLNSNLPPALLLQGKYQEAKALYKALMGQPFASDSRFTFFKDAFLTDFAAFEKAGIIPKLYKGDVEKIKGILKEEE